jgi:hypothetical protein
MADLKATSVLIREVFDLGIKGCGGFPIRCAVKYTDGVALEVDVDDGAYVFKYREELERCGQTLLYLAAKLPTKPPPTPRKPRKPKVVAKRAAAKKAAPKRTGRRR